MLYLIIKDIRLNVYEDIAYGGVDARSEMDLTLAVKSNGFTFEQIKELFTGITDITIYSCVIQEDGRETDDFVIFYFDTYTQLKDIAYNIENDFYQIHLMAPNETEERLAELEDAVNFLLMGGDE